MLNAKCKNKKTGLFLLEKSCEAGFQTGCFIFVDNISFCGFVQPLKDRRECFGGRRFPRGFDERAELYANRRILFHCFPIVAKFLFSLFRDRHEKKYTIKNSKLKIEGDRYIL